MPHLQLPYPFLLRNFLFGQITIQLFVPDAEQMQAVFHQKQGGPKPYWSKVWPAALGLCQYIAAHPQLVKGKEVMEMAGGLGLPSLLAAHWAHNAWCTDIAQEAVSFAYASAQQNQLENFTATVLDWNELEPDLVPDVMLLSDINYEPEAFATLHTLLLHLLQKGTTVILSTPQRLVAKSFIEQLLPWCKQQEATTVLEAGIETGVSIYVLQG